VKLTVAGIFLFINQKNVFFIKKGLAYEEIIIVYTKQPKLITGIMGYVHKTFDPLSIINDLLSSILVQEVIFVLFVNLVSYVNDDMYFNKTGNQIMNSV
jgi:hypothetical protein